MTRLHTAAGLALLAIAACRREPPPEPEVDTPAIAETRWTGRTELFVEYPPLSAGTTGRFAVHLTRLDTFKPITAGRVSVRLAGTTTETFATDAPSNPGIFGVNVTPKAAGTYRMAIVLESKEVSDVHDVGAVIVYADDREAIAATRSPDEEGGISFLKEQQWTLDFGTALATREPLRASTTVQGEVRARPGGDAVVTAPVAGRIVTAAARSLGALVRRGDVLAEILPRSADAGDRAGAEYELSQATAAIELAGAELRRAERLAAEGAAPGRRVKEAEVARGVAQARADAARTRLQQIDAVRTGGASSAASRYAVHAPITGVMAATAPVAGTSVEEGHELFRIVAVDRVHVIAHVPEDAAGALPSVHAAEIASGDAVLPVGRLISRGRVVDPVSRTVPVVFEWNRPDPAIAVGQSVTVRLLEKEGSPAVVVPESAIVDDGGRPVVFLQSSGETFERRPVRVGRREGGRVEIVEGVREGDRVVSRGAPLVRLAALSTQVPSHGHVH